jgi:GT2 family glycosyltransferase
MISGPGYGIVILTKYAEVLEPLIDSISKFTPDEACRKILVCDGSEKHYWGYDNLSGAKPFVWGINANKGINALAGLDVFLLNDDVQLLEPDTFTKLYEVAYRFPNAGIVCPLIKGWCVPPRARWHERDIWPKGETEYYVPQEEYISFAFVFLKRAMIRSIGGIDERFIEYGWTDKDYCVHAGKYGWKSLVTRQAVVQHGDGSVAGHEGQGKSWCTTFVKDGYFKRTPTSPFKVS